MSPALVNKLATQLQTTGEIQPHEILSTREFQVLRMIGAGKNTQDIAAKLSLSPKTIGTYRSRILAKMNLKSNAELLFYVVENGLID